MDYYKRNNVYTITRITGNRDNILGISFAEKNSSEDNIEVMIWDFPKCDKSRIQTAKEKVLTQVLSGLNWINKLFGTDYKVSKVYYVPSEDGSNSMYEFLTISTKYLYEFSRILRYPLNTRLFKVFFSKNKKIFKFSY